MGLKRPGIEQEFGLIFMSPTMGRYGDWGGIVPRGGNLEFEDGDNSQGWGGCVPILSAAVVCFVGVTRGKNI